MIFGAFAVLWTFVCFFLVTFALLLAPIDVSGYSVDDRDRLIADAREVIIRNKAELDKQAQQQGVSL